jgi:FkbM family methyltransferase
LLYFNEMSLKNYILKIIRLILNPVGYDIVKYKTTYPSQIVLNHLKYNNITVVLDVGANTGQYSHELRKAGYKGRIISFEPLNEAFLKLRLNASNDKNWQVFNYALGEANGSATIHVSKHSPSSSLLPMTKLHNEAAPGSEYVKEERIEIKTLDSIFKTLGIGSEKVFMKVDTQGYEKNVLEGAAGTIPAITGIQLELSASRLYQGEDLYYSICRFVEERNFHLVRIIPGFNHAVTHDMLQFDALFFKIAGV